MTKKIILIIDDELNILKSLRRLLEDKFDVEIALGAQEGINLIKERNEKFDIILCDFMMPFISGADFYNVILNDHSKLQHRIIFMTGCDYSPIMQKFFAQHHCLYLPKPFDHDDLLNIIQKVLI